MTLRLHYDEATGEFDLSVRNGALETSDDLETPVIICLFTWRRANADELKQWGLTPDQNEGSWQEDHPEEPGDREGSLLWLCRHGKKEPSTLRAAEGFARDALSVFIRKAIAKRIDARAYWYPGTDILVLEIDLFKANGERWSRAWNATTGEQLPFAA